MLVSHEVPISMLEYSPKFNDYDYCLLHLIYEYPEYKRYYKEAVLNGRTVILDNSIFELGEALTNAQLAEGVLELSPTYYIVPDCFDDYEETLFRFSSFLEEYPDLPGRRMGVIQGRTVEELIKCYLFMSKHADKIGIPFGSIAYDELVSSNDKLTRLCEGRQKFIQKLVDIGLWNSHKPHHLLGCSYAREFSYPLYKKINIESCDTSNPIVAGLYKIRYKETGLNTKPATKLCDLILSQPDEAQLDAIFYNIKQFKKICNLSL